MDIPYVEYLSEQCANVLTHNKNELLWLSLWTTLILLITYTILKKLFHKKEDKVLIIGPCGSGKTALFHRLIYNSYYHTFTSMQINQHEYINNSKKGKKLILIDIPGHRFLSKKIDGYLKETSGVIYMIDASDFIDHIKEITEQIMQVFQNRYFKSKKIPFVIACNKSDYGFKCHSENFIMKKIEREINALLDSDSLDVGMEEYKSFKKYYNQFLFENFKGQITVVKLSVESGDNVSNLHQFLDKI